jgi:hypothetical protein
MRSRSTQPENFFQPNSSFGDPAPSSKPTTSPEYPRFEVNEFFESGLRSDAFDFNTSNVVVANPVPDLKQAQSAYIGYPDYLQLAVECDNGVLVADAPPHRS